MIRVVLYEPEKPANTGNIIRTCMAFSAALSIVGPVSFDLSDKALRRAKMDYALSFPIERIDTIEDFLRKYSWQEGYFVTRYGAKTYAEADFSDPARDYWLMFGRESTGIPKEVLKAYPERDLRIPMVPDARSLNLANSVAIVLSEALRQQGFKGLSRREEIKGEDFLRNYPVKED